MQSPIPPAQSGETEKERTAGIGKKHDLSMLKRTAPELSGAGSAQPETDHAQIVHPEAPPGQDFVFEVPLFFNTSKAKLIVMSLCTFGIYEIYWFYKNWKFLKEEEGLNISVGGRTFFALIYCYSLFKKVREYAEKNGLSTNYSPGLLTLVFIVLNLACRAPHPVWMVTNLAVLALLPCQGAINKLNEKLRPGSPVNNRYGGWNIAGIVFGAILWLLIFVGMLLPE